MDLHEFYCAKFRTYINLKQYDELLSILEEPLINEYPLLPRRPTVYLMVHLLILACSGRRASDFYADVPSRALNILKEYYNFYLFCASRQGDNEIDKKLLMQLQCTLIKFTEFCFLGTKVLGDKYLKVELNDLFDTCKKSTNDEYFNTIFDGCPIVFSIGSDPWKFIYYGLNHTQNDYDMWFPVIEVLFGYLRLDLDVKQKKHENSLIYLMLKQLSSRFYVLKALEIIFDDGPSAKRFRGSLRKIKREQKKLRASQNTYEGDNNVIISEEETPDLTDNYYINKRLELKRCFLRLIFRGIMFSDVSSVNYTGYLKDLVLRLKQLNFIEFSNFFFLDDDETNDVSQMCGNTCLDYTNSFGSQSLTDSESQSTIMNQSKGNSAVLLSAVFDKNFLVDTGIIYLQLFTSFNNTFTTKFELKHNKVKNNTVKRLAFVLSENYNFENLVSLEPEIDDLKANKSLTLQETIFGDDGLLSRYKRINLIILLVLHAWLQELTETGEPIDAEYVLQTIERLEAIKVSNLITHLNGFDPGQNRNYEFLARSQTEFLAANIKTHF